MAPEWFKALCCIRQPPPSDDAPPASTDPVLVLTEVPVEGSGSLSPYWGLENTRARSLGPSPSPGDTNIPVPASSRWLHCSPSNSTGALAPALIEAQPTVPCAPEESTDTPVPAHTEEVAVAASTAISPMISLDPAQAREHIDRIDRFRILVMGRANAGKTTILQRVCNTTDQPEIFNGEGEKRGEHNIEDELVFKSNQRFVFHDSRGFEAGKFVMDRAKTMKLDKRIHAIWFCIPLHDSHRMVTAAEKKFFNKCDTGHVPVIVLLTKADTLALDAFMELVDDGLNEDDAMERAAEVKGWLNKSRFPPHDYLSLTGMEEEGADCTTLLTCTANALNEEGLQQLLISTQQSNLGLCMEFAITKTLKNCMQSMVGKITPAGLAYYLSTWFPYVRR
ncbi:hypothetical protein BKA82DRAFT_4099770 [Pisolithus tinctorius]|nr:hypothetical protein BKA82DRAFT_4099770 [Pisolithus tinctorius]